MKYTTILSITLASLLATACLDGSAQYRNRIEELERALDLRAEEKKRNDDFLKEISTSLDQVEAAESELNEEMQSGSQKERILDKIDALEAALTKSQLRIASLEKRLEEAEGLKSVVNQLRAKLAEKEQEIAELRQKVATLEGENEELRKQQAETNTELAEERARVMAFQDTVISQKERIDKLETEQQINEWIKRGDAEVAAGDEVKVGLSLSGKKRKGKNRHYKNAVYYYRQAAGLGSSEAGQKIKAAQAKIKE